MTVSSVNQAAAQSSRYLLMALMSVTLLPAAAADSFAADTERPNVVLLMTDDQGFGDVAYNGHPVLKTPTLDAMAASALRLDRFYAAAPVCSPTRGSVMTGRHPNRFGCFSWGHTLRPQEYTLAEAMKQAGYATGHFGKWHLGPVRSDSPVSPGRSGFDEWISSPNFYDNSPLLAHNGKVIPTEGESSMVTVDLALPFIRTAAAGNQPFLAVIWFGNPHAPHQALPELQQLYPNATRAEQNYYGEITGIDRAIGRLRDELRTLGIADNTLVWFTSDNGAQGRSAGSTGGLRGAKGDLWEGGIRVPTVIEWPARIASPRTTEFPAFTSDILPTILELAGVDLSTLPHPLDGISLVPLIDNKVQRRDKPMGFWVYPEGGIRTPSAEILAQQLREQEQGDPLSPLPPLTPTALLEKDYASGEYPGRSALIDGDWKLHRIPANGNRGSTFRLELYNLAADPAEQNDVAAQHTEVTQRLHKELEAWLQSVVGSLNGADYR